MFCAFEGAARILRLFGTGEVYEFGTPEYFELIPPRPSYYPCHASGSEGPKASVHPVGAPEPPSDGTVVVLGNRVPTEMMRALLVPASREEMVRLVLAVTLDVMLAAMYVQVFEPRC